MFAIKVPKDFGAEADVDDHGERADIVSPSGLNPAYWVDFFKHAANGNEPPVIKLAPNGPDDDGPAARDRADVVRGRRPAGALTLWASDVPTQVNEGEEELAANRAPAARGNQDARRDHRWSGHWRCEGRRGGTSEPPDITVNWSKHRGPGDVTFAQSRIPLVTKGNPTAFLEATTTASSPRPASTSSAHRSTTPQATVAEANAAAAPGRGKGDLPSYPSSLPGLGLPPPSDPLLRPGRTPPRLILPPPARPTPQHGFSPRSISSIRLPSKSFAKKNEWPRGERSGLLTHSTPLLTR